MNKNIEDYFFHKKEFLDKDFCEHALDILKQSKWERHDFTGYETNDPEHGFGWTREVKSSPSGSAEPEFLGHTGPGWKEEQAKINNLPIVALESTIISHGMPYPSNILEI